MTSNQTSTSYLSRFIAFLLPMILAAYWPLFGTGQSVHAGVIFIRLSLMACAALLVLIWLGERAASTERLWIVIFAAYLGVSLLSSLAGANASRGLHNWFRIVAVYCVAVGLAKPLRHKASEQALGLALAAAGVLSFLFIVAIYLHYAGFGLPTYERIREYKTLVQHSSGIALNPLASATLLFCVLSLCLLKTNWAHWGAAAAIAVFSSALTGSRAPLALALVSGAAVVATNLLHSREPALRGIACAAICSVGIAMVLVFLFVDPLLLSAATEGRYDVWSVGVSKFLEQPARDTDRDHGRTIWSAGSQDSIRAPAGWPTSMRAVITASSSRFFPKVACFVSSRQC